MSPIDRSEHEGGTLATAASSDDGETATGANATEVAGPDDPFLADADGLPVGLSEGSRIDRFEVVGKLGEGGMGVVVSAYDPTLERKVAIKLLRAAQTTRSTRTRLLREAQAMARVQHDAIVAVHEVGTSDGRIYVVMELVDGDTLARWQRTHGWRDVLAIYLRAGRGLAAAHAAGLVHRDFKPANVLVGRDGRVRVTDFGLVAASGSTHDDPDRDADRDPADHDASALHMPLTRTGDVMGTPAYMAPEQYRGKAADARADQFSFCVALWEGLYGIRPYEAKDAHARRERVLLGELDPAPRDRGVPAWLEPILRRGLDPDPGGRWPDLDALLTALAADPDAARARTRRTAMIAGGVATIAAGAAVIAMLAMRGRDREPPCRGLERELRGVWDADREDALARAFAATGKRYANDTAARVIGALDDRARAWTAMRVDACEATAVTQSQSPEMLDRRMACLDRRRAELGATVELLTGDAAASMPRAVDAVLQLPALDACDADRVIATAPMPADPKVRAAIARARTDLDRGTALIRDGRYKDALAPAAAAVAAATAIGWPPLDAEAYALEARARLTTGDTRAAETELHQALAAASAAGDTALQAKLTVSLVEVANREARYVDVDTLGKLAEATLGTSDDRWEDRATLESEVGRAALARQQIDDARVHVQLALELRRRHAGADSLLAARSLQDLAEVALRSAKFAEADALFRQVLAIKERAVGPDHPELASTLSNLSITAKELEHYDEGAAFLHRAIDILTAAEGDGSPRLAAAWANLGVILGYQQKGDESLAALQKALAVREKVLPPDHPDLASSIMNIGIALDEDLGRPAEAIPYFERARDILSKKLGPDHPTLAYALHGLGACYVDLKQPARGVADLAEAYRIRSLPDVDPQLKADTGYMLAQALWASGKPGSAERARARALATEAAAIYRQLGSPEGAKQIDAWSATHPR